MLVDPMLDDAAARPPVENTPNPLRNPLVPLPVPAAEVVRDLDAVIVTHLHRDHLDDTGARLLPRDVPVFCQPEDEEALVALGLGARPVDAALDWEGLPITRTEGRHGTGAVAELLAPVSGFILGDLQIAGDTVWCPEVEEAIAVHQPRVTVINGSGARFVDSGPLVMTISDIQRVVARVPVVVSFISKRSTTASRRGPKCALPCRKRSSQRTARPWTSSGPSRSCVGSSRSGRVLRARSRCG